MAANALGIKGDEIAMGKLISSRIFTSSLPFINSKGCNLKYKRAINGCARSHVALFFVHYLIGCTKLRRPYCFGKCCSHFQVMDANSCGGRNSRAPAPFDLVSYG